MFRIILLLGSISSLFNVESKKIVGGTAIPIEKAPYVVSVQYNDYKHFCGGSLISKNLILSAAHCFEEMDPKGITFRLGSANSTSGGILIPAKKIELHEKYNSKPIKNDIAIILLNETVQKNSSHRASYKEPPQGSQTFASGWGVKKFGEKITPEELQGVYLDTISKKECQKAFGSTKIDDKTICAYSEDKDTCRGDSGGPLAWKAKLLGIVSWGIGCAKKHPGVYTSVPKHYKWIQKTKKILEE
uniref:Peptidase S1 domain-containing protein n=1 Tax=Megaselia scalaris TaxID=36166 RepID=T1GF99_MEGSC